MWAVSFQCMTKSTTNKNNNNKKINKTVLFHFQLHLEEKTYFSKELS